MDAKQKKPASVKKLAYGQGIKSGGVLLFHAVTHGGSSALPGLTSEFGRGSGVTLEVRDLGTEVQFPVKDRGPGIAAPDQSHLFELLFRGQSTGREDGLGLGLAIVKRIIDAHGGRIWVESSEGPGATFHFILPRSALP